MQKHNDEIHSDPHEERTTHLSLDAEQWVGLLDSHGKWLPPCCASISAARDVLANVLRRSGEFRHSDALEILCEIGDHDGSDNEGLRAIFAGNPGTLFWTRQGSPWFAIARACVELLGNVDPVETARTLRREAFEREREAERIATSHRAQRLAERLYLNRERTAPAYSIVVAPSWRELHPAPRNLEIAAMYLLLTKGDSYDVSKLPDGRATTPARPRIVALCGSTRFREAYEAAERSETDAGRVVLTVAPFPRRSATTGLFAEDVTNEALHARCALHQHRVDLSDELLVLNVGGYIGEDTRRTIDHAIATGKTVRYLEPVHPQETR